MTVRIIPTVLGKRSLRELYCCPQTLSTRDRCCTRLTPRRPVRSFATETAQNSKTTKDGSSAYQNGAPSADNTASALSPADWEENPDLSISRFTDLPSKNFGVNQHMIINEEFKEALRQILWQFRAPIRYAFAYGSGVFSQSGSGGSSPVQSVHPSPSEAIEKVQTSGPKMIDFIFGVSYTQHWHSLNLGEHRKHYSALGSLGSYSVSKIQDSFGAGVYFNPYITVNGTLIKYGVVNIDTLCRDLSGWNTLYLAGRLQKPVKILRDHPAVRVANQINLLSAVRTALLLLPPDFTEQDLYAQIAGISYLGDPRMSLPAENPRKVINIVAGQITNFRRLYKPLIDQLPNLTFNDPRTSGREWDLDESVNAKLAQDMDPVRRGNMVRRLPKSFREKLYFEYQAKFGIPRGEFSQMLEESAEEDTERFGRREGGRFEQRIAKDETGLKKEIEDVIRKTVRWPSTVESFKGLLTAGISRSWRYAKEKREKAKAGERDKKADQIKTDTEKRQTSK
ncbi:MAG: hypothetical protein Q9227_005636 [Pyrenula ochraceoflavens]